MKNQNYEKTASGFCRKYREFYQGKGIDEEVTQSLWHSLSLSKNRFAKLGIEQDIKIVENGFSGPGDSDVRRAVEVAQGNGRKTTMVETPVSIRRRYYKNGKKLAEKIDYTSQAVCLILEKDGGWTENEKREIVCPTCGAIGSRESLFDGCDYCGRQFRVENEERKVSAFAVFHDAVAGTAKELKNNGILLMISIVLLAICVGLGTQSFFLQDKLLSGVVLSKIATILGCIVLANAVVLFAARRWAKKHQVDRLEKTKALQDLETECTDFHFSKFTEDLEYKLKSIHFAQKKEDILMFANETVANGLALYENVLDCQIKNCKVAEYRQDEKYHHIQVSVSAVLTILQGNKICEKEEALELTMYRSKEAVVSKSLVSYSCNSCGSSVNLLNGGVCDYCGQRLKLENYDWVIDTYVSSRIKPKDTFKKCTKFLAIGLSILMLLLNITNLRVAFAAASRSFSDMNASVYMLGNEMIPSLENYGYAFLQESHKKKDDGVEYHYKYVDGSSHIFVDYPQHLVNENGFEMLENSDGFVALQRNKEFSKGRICVVICKNADSEYVISIVETTK